MEESKSETFLDEKLKNPIKKLHLPLVEDRRRSSLPSVTKRTVLVAVDSSDHSRHAFEWYLNHVWKHDDLVCIVYCPEVASLPTFSFKNGIGLPTNEWAKILEDLNKKTAKLEEDYEYTCREKKIRYKFRCESHKNPGEGICKIADSETASMIVMGTRGIGAVKRVLLGSVSEYVTRNSKIPCIIIPH